VQARSVGFWTDENSSLRMREMQKAMVGAAKSASPIVRFATKAI
jgi:hypothetical protein